MSLDGQVIQKGFDLGLSHRFGVFFLVMQNELSDPENIGLFCPGAVMFDPASGSHLV